MQLHSCFIFENLTIQYFEFYIFSSFSGLSCMSANCDTLANEDFVLSHISMENVHVRDMYNQLSFRDYVRSHPQLRFCPGNNCKLIIKAVVRVAKRVVCTTCKSSFWYVLNHERRNHFERLLQVQNIHSCRGVLFFVVFWCGSVQY